MELKYGLGRSQLRKYILFPLLKLLTIFIAGASIGVVWFEVERQNLLVVIGFTWAWFFLMHVLPLSILAIRHTQLSNGAYFSIDTANQRYQYNKNDISISFQLNEIEKVVKVVSPPAYDKRADILGFGYFFYWKVVLTDGRSLLLSGILLDVVDFPGKEFSQEKRMFPVPAVWAAKDRAVRQG
jgi:hypothetical protein